jgi:hypothetical protein
MLGSSSQITERKDVAVEIAVLILLKRESEGRLFCSVIRTQQHGGVSPKLSRAVQSACVRAVDLGEIGSCSTAEHNSRHDC